MPEYLGCAAWIATRDLATTVRHYREVLGFADEDWSWSWGDPPDHAGVSRGKARLAFFVPDDDRAERFRGMEVVVYVRGVAEAYAEHRAAGARIVQELDERPWGTIDYTVEDPNGVRLVFTEAPESF